MRDNIFSDQLVLFSGRRLGIFLLILGGVSLFSGIDQVVIVKKLTSEALTNLLDHAEEDFLKKRYKRVIIQSKEIVRSDPKNVRAWELSIESLLAVGDRKKARKNLTFLLYVDPEHPFKDRKILKKL